MGTALVGGLVHSLHLELHEFGPGSVILVQGWSGLLNHDGASRRGLFFIHQQVQGPQVAGHIGGPGTLNVSQELAFLRGVALAVNLLHQLGNLNCVLRPADEERVNQALVVHQKYFHGDATVLI